MSEIESTKPDGGGWASAWVTAVLAVSAAVAMGYWSSRALDERDTEAMESPLMLSVARQLIVGPGELYGPFGGSNPLVLIHAPLYYRAAAVLAWPMARAGLHPVVAARVGGRAVSALGLAAAMAAAYRLGRLGGLPRRAGWWSALLLAASPLLGGQPFAVRPDMAGVALQAWGVALALESLAGPRRRFGRASALFGLAVCVKQHLVVGWAVGAGLASWWWMRGRLGLGCVVRLVVPGLLVAGSIYGAEYVVTGGRVWEAAFVAAANVGRVHPGDWDKVTILFLGIANRSSGVAALLAASAFVAAARRPGMLRPAWTGAGIVAIGTVLGAVVYHAIISKSISGLLTVAAVAAAAVVALSAAAIAARFRATAKGVDAILWAYLAAEIGLIVLLTRASAGAWMNYGIPAVLLAAALAGRALSRVLEAGMPAATAAPVMLALAVLLTSILQSVGEARWDLRRDGLLSGSIYDRLGGPRSSYFFSSRPGFNRVNGRIDLVYDDWLYPVFESIGLAEPRSAWLLQELASGPVRVVVNPTPRPVVEGTMVDLRRLGYRPDVQLETYYYVWIR